MTLTRAAVARETARRKRRLDLLTGEEIRKLRLDAGITLTALSAVVGVIAHISPVSRRALQAPASRFSRRSASRSAPI